MRKLFQLTILMLLFEGYGTIQSQTGTSEYKIQNTYKVEGDGFWDYLSAIIIP
jgi:hypothetical protein